MKVKLKVSRAGVGFSQNAKEVIEVSDEEGARLINAGQADPVNVIERAVKNKPVEKAVKK